MNVQAIREALANVAKAAIPRAYWWVPEKIEPPMLTVVPSAETFITYNDAMRGGLVTLNFDAVVYVQRADDRAAQMALDAYLTPGTPTSLFDAFMANRTLEGLVSDVLVSAATNYGRAVQVGDETFGQAALSLTVRTTR